MDAIAAVRFPAPFSRRKVDRDINGFEFHTKMIVLSLLPLKNVEDLKVKFASIRKNSPREFCKNFVNTQSACNALKVIIAVYSRRTRNG